MGRIKKRPASNTYIKYTVNTVQGILSVLNLIGLACRRTIVVGSSFFIPLPQKQHRKRSVDAIKSAVLIPTYRPSHATISLINTIISVAPKVKIVVIDDCTPLTSKNRGNILKIKEIAQYKKNVTYLRTPHNTLKAGALNFGLKFLQSSKTKYQVVFTLDDDITIDEQTFPQMIHKLFSSTKIGAVCSQALVKNKDKNLLTRLQSLEYHGFNITKTADNTFLQGPLVMQGMLTAFKMTALKSVKGFSVGHLIEDYDITARLKNKGWHVGIVQAAYAWTSVPESIEGLWRQRIRWSYGGLRVISQYWQSPSTVFQDLYGHLTFLTLLALVVISFFEMKNPHQDTTLIELLISVALVNFIVSFIFNIFMLVTYPRRDRLDWIIKLSILPEFLYCNMLSMILIGSYLFFGFNSLAKVLNRKFKSVNPFTDTLFSTMYQGVLVIFQRLGYSSNWGTR